MQKDGEGEPQIRTGLELRLKKESRNLISSTRTDKKPRSRDVILHFYCKMWSNILSWCMDSLILRDI